MLMSFIQMDTLSSITVNQEHEASALYHEDREGYIMKVTAKRAIAAALSLMMIAATASTVNASDYRRGYAGPASGGVGVYPAGGGSVGPTDGDSSPLKTGIVRPQDLLDNSVIRIPDDGAILLPSTLAKMGRDGGSYTFKQENGASMTIDGSSVTDASASKKIGVKIVASKKSKAVKVIFLSDTPDFGYTVKVRIPSKVCKDIGLNVKTAKAMHVSDSGKASNYDGISAGRDGSVTLSASHASYYIIASADTFDDVMNSGDLGGLSENVSAGAATVDLGVEF